MLPALFPLADYKLEALPPRDLVITELNSARADDELLWVLIVILSLTPKWQVEGSVHPRALFLNLNNHISKLYVYPFSAMAMANTEANGRLSGSQCDHPVRLEYWSEMRVLGYRTRNL